MAKGARNRPREKRQSKRAYLVRSYMCLPLGEAEGYFFSLAESQQGLRKLVEQYPEETLPIEEYQDPDQTAPNLAWPPRYPEQ
jgi:hypothetical protein